MDADYSVKSYKGKREDGRLWEKIVSWFNYKLHLIADSDYELLVAYFVTKASVSDVKEAYQLFDLLESNPSNFIESTKIFTGGYGVR